MTYDIFNSKGELNAYDTRSAFAQIAKLASTIAENTPSNMSLAPSGRVSDPRRDELVARAMGSAEGRAVMAQSMANPIRRNLDYQGMSRRALNVDMLAQGAIPTYDRDIDVTAVTISSQGAPPESRVFGERIFVPEFTIASNATARIEEIRMRRFNVVDRMVQKMRQEIMAQEDANVFSALNTAGTQDNVLQDIADAGLLKRDLINLKQQIDQWDLLTTKFFMNISEFTDILRWGAGGGTLGEVDPVTQREILQTGLQARIWGADILVSKLVPVGTVFGTADPDFVGVMPVRQDIEVMPADEMKQLKVGFVASEIIGIAITNSRGVSVGSKSAAVG